MRETTIESVMMEQVAEGFPALWTHLRQCDECAVAFVQLMRLARDQGDRASRSDNSPARWAVMSGLAGVLAIVMLLGGLLIWHNQTAEPLVSRIYQLASPAVANIQVQSAGVTGSGVVFDRNGYLLTNYHVISGARSDQDVFVQLPGLGQVPSRLLGYDIATDLAVLQVDAPAERLTVANFGDPGVVRTGDLAIAIGNPFGLSYSVTVGYISAVGRRLMSTDPYAPDVEGVLQTDAAINPGNSGGPLFNARGQVIGINTRMESPSGGSVGIGFAIPSDTALRVAREIIDQGYVSRPFPGVSGRPIQVGHSAEACQESHCDARNPMGRHAH